MNDDPEQTYSAREIVLEFFPATPERLIPRTNRYRLRRATDGDLVVREGRKERLRLVPVPSAGSDTTQLCCDLCQWTDRRQLMQTVRAEVPGSNGRRFRYLTACRDYEACEARRLGDETIEALIQRFAH